MLVKIGKNAKKILQGIDAIKYSKFVNGLYKIDDPKSPLIVEKENEVLNKVENLIKKYFPEVLEDYKIVLNIVEFNFLDGPKYFLNLRKRN